MAGNDDVGARKRNVNGSANGSANGHVNGNANGSANGHVNGAPVKEGLSGWREGHRDEKTDYSRWRLEDERGRHIWKYLESDEECKKWPQTVADKYHLGMETVSTTPPETPSLPPQCRPDCGLEWPLIICICCRASLISRLPKHLSIAPRMPSPSSPASNTNLAIGPANTAVPCSCSRVSSSPGT